VNLTMKIKKEDLIKRLKSNLVKHEKDYQKAMKGWQRKIASVAAKLAAAAKKGTLKDVKMVRELNGLSKPNDMREHYRKTISMISHSVEAIIQLDEFDFTRFMQDDWDWKADWTTSNIGYMGR